MSSLSDPSLGVHLQASSSLCAHGRARSLEPCAQCWLDVMMQARRAAKDEAAAKKNRRFAALRMPCEHCPEMRRCKVCMGNSVCAHGKNKVYCRVCDGRRLCQVCRGVTLPRAWEVCARCKAERAGLERLARKKCRPAI